MNKVSSANISKEISEITLVNSHEGLNLPFNNLSDRAFEVLNYLLFKEKIARNFSDINESFDHVDLMQGVAEQGRDCVLLKDQSNVGIIQCKKVSANLSKPQFAKEIIKFAIHSIVDKTIISDINNFTYYLVVSHGLAGSTKQLIREFNTRILLEPQFKDWSESVIEENAAFKALNFNIIETELKSILSKIRVQRILPQDLESDLTLFPEIEKQFFKIRTVVDTSEIRFICEKYLDPILSKLSPTEKKVSSFKTDFKEYLERSFKENSSARTLVFGNQQKKLEEFYYPLELISHDVRVKTNTYPMNLLPEYKKVLIVDSGGMGKSTIMKWLFIQAIKKKKGIPIFVELRRLSKDHSLISEIHSQINGLSKKFDIQFLLDLIEKGNFIFFLDGYDEIRSIDRSAVTKDIGEFISKASVNEFIITSRPDNIEGLFAGFRTFKVKKLIPNEAYKLIERIGNFNERSLALITKIKESD